MTNYSLNLNLQRLAAAEHLQAQIEAGNGGEEGLAALIDALEDMIEDVEGEEQGDIFATNKDRTMCFGAWQNSNDRGITFAKPRPLMTVVHPKMTLKQMLTAPPFKKGI